MLEIIKIFSITYMDIYTENELTKSSSFREMKSKFFNFSLHLLLMRQGYRTSEYAFEIFGYISIYSISSTSPNPFLSKSMHLYFII